MRSNLVEEVEKPSQEEDTQRMYILSVEEERKYFSYLRSRRVSENGNLHDVGRLMIQQGMRPEEAMALPKVNVNLGKRTLRVGKSKTRKGRGRILKLTTESWQILARRMSSPGPWIFPSNRREGAHITKLNCPHDRALEKLKMHFVFYDLRHTFATRFIESGGHVIVLKDLLGHRDISTTMCYVHISQEHQFEAMEKFEKARLAADKQFDEEQLSVERNVSLT
ncbi:MAG: tyrosine-type recombinase/integrase [Bryobacteraceae bacterium]